MRPEARENMTNELRNHAARKYGIIKCYGPDGEYYEARSQREATEMTKVAKSTISHALKNDLAAKGWVFVREPDTVESE